MCIYVFNKYYLYIYIYIYIYKRYNINDILCIYVVISECIFTHV